MKKLEIAKVQLNYVNLLLKHEKHLSPEQWARMILTKAIREIEIERLQKVG